MRTIEPMIILAMRDALACSESTFIPYLPHPMDVCRLVLACGGSQLAACAAVLHEVVALGHIHLEAVAQRYGSGGADDEEALLLLCADRVAHLVRWSHMAPSESLAREMNDLNLALRRLEPAARQVLAGELERIHPEVLVPQVVSSRKYSTARRRNQRR